MSGNERYDYFIRKIADFEEVWGLFNDGWAMIEDSTGKRGIPFWPEEDFAKLCSKNEWCAYSPKKIELDAFIDKWIPGMKNDGLSLAIFQTPENKGIFVESDLILSDLENELEQYE